MKLFAIAVIAAVFTFLACPTSAQSIAEVLREPRLFNSKEVRLSGIARGDVVPFEIYPDQKSATEMKSSNALAVIMVRDAKKGGPYDLRRVELTGVIDASRRGTWGRNPCSIIVRKAVVLSGPVATWPDTAVVIRNVSGIRLAVTVKDHFYSHIFELGPGEYDAQYIKGESTLTARTLGGVEETKATVTRPRDGTFFDPVNAAIYYEISQAGVKRVLPESGRKWGWHR